MSSVATGPMGSFRLTWLLCLVVAAAGAACGDDDDDGSGPAAGTGGAETGSPSGPITLLCFDDDPGMFEVGRESSLTVIQPELGDDCEMQPISTPEGSRSASADLNVDGVLTGDEACLVLEATRELTPAMFCHPEFKVCVLSCSSDADCPKGWACDSRRETLEGTRGMDLRINGAPICVDPTCIE